LPAFCCGDSGLADRAVERLLLEDKRTKIRWDNFKNTLWDSVGLRRKVGHAKHLKLHFHLRPPLGTFGQNYILIPLGFF
jgi:hypothetical protein